MEAIDLIASGYDWGCPNCNEPNTEDCVPSSEVLQCTKCKKTFERGEINHAYE